MSATIIVLVTAEEGGDFGDEYTYPETKTFHDFRNFLNDPKMQDRLAEHGYGKIEDDKGMLDTAKLEGKFFVCNLDERPYAYGGNRYMAVEPVTEKDDIVTVRNVKGFAEGRVGVFQLVDPKSILSEDQLKLIKKEEKKAKRIAEARKKAAKTKAENKKKKEIEKAKKILEEAGELK